MVRVPDGVRRDAPVRLGPLVARWTDAQVRALRAAMRLTLADFALRLGVRARTVGYWEVGVTPSGKNAVALDKALMRADAETQQRFAALVAEAARTVPAEPAGPDGTGTGGGGGVLWAVHLQVQAADREHAAEIARAVCGLVADQVPQLRRELATLSRANDDRHRRFVFCGRRLGRARRCGLPDGHGGECAPFPPRRPPSWSRR